MEIHISDRTHKFQHKTGLDAKDNSELYKSKQVNSVPLAYTIENQTRRGHKGIFSPNRDDFSQKFLKVKQL